MRLNETLNILTIMKIINKNILWKNECQSNATNIYFICFYFIS